MPTYKLIYFNARGRAELTRLALSAAGIQFEDVRLNSEEWKALKPTLLQGQLPVLEVDGTVIEQSGAMARYVARESGLYGKNNMENSMVDMVIGTVDDFNAQAVKVFFEEDKTKKAEMMKELAANTVPKYLKIFAGILGDEKQWMVGSELSIADLAVYNTLELMVNIGKDILAEHDKLKAHFNQVKSQPNIKEWLERRPETDH